MADTVGAILAACRAAMERLRTSGTRHRAKAEFLLEYLSRPRRAAPEGTIMGRLTDEDRSPGRVVILDYADHGEAGYKFVFGHTRIPRVALHICYDLTDHPRKKSFAVDGVHCGGEEEVLKRHKAPPVLGAVTGVAGLEPPL